MMSQARSSPPGSYHGSTYPRSHPRPSCLLLAAWDMQAQQGRLRHPALGVVATAVGALCEVTKASVSGMVAMAEMRAAV